MKTSRTTQNFDHLRNLGRLLRRFGADVGAGLDALHRVQFDEPWTRNRRPTYEEWQAYIAPRPRALKPERTACRGVVAKPAPR